MRWLALKHVLKCLGCVAHNDPDMVHAHIVLETWSTSVGVYATSNGHETTSSVEQVALSVPGSLKYIHCLLSKDGYRKKGRMEPSS
jgi:hypothetical protein